ncbi:PAAR domain-containing protein [Rhizobium sp. Leaf262]|uniref:PAAR domain-containing protein n=1 Tax=Rhizobium sp. Leaf262 TaxID=1736312 RepID=UPI001FCDCEF8|nr:PAAR domain-containing protein [Rhizobium sp. Leaf262]
MRVGDSYVPHRCRVCPEPVHGRKLAAGSSTVFINGKPGGRIGDAIDCGGQAQTGSPNVFIGDEGEAGGTECQKNMASQSKSLVRR